MDVLVHTRAPQNSWASRFSKAARRQERLRITRSVGGSKCPGAWDTYTGDYDPLQDRNYHSENPSAEVCVNGIAGATNKIEDWYAFVAHDLTTQQLRDLKYGELEDNDLVIFVPIDYSFSESPNGEAGNVTRVEFPIGTGRYYRPENQDVWIFQGTPLYRYSLLVVEDEGAGTGIPPGMDS
jgi:hypothetical protein